ncbi:MAG: hypothetical protein ACRC17_06120 [Culicoidibacterales bacterium]
MDSIIEISYWSCEDEEIVFSGDLASAKAFFFEAIAEQVQATEEMLATSTCEDDSLFGYQQTAINNRKFISTWDGRNIILLGYETCQANCPYPAEMIISSPKFNL